MKDRINAAQIGEFVRAAMELHASGRTALKMHEIVSHAWAPGVTLPEIATSETLRKVAEVRRSLVENEGCVIAPIAQAYFTKVTGKVFTEIEAGQCLPRRSAPQIGFLFIGPESSPKDVMVWEEWVRREAAVTNSRGTEVVASVHNAVHDALLTELESQKLLAIEGPSHLAE